MKSILDDLSFAVCGVCGGDQDSGFGYAPDEKHKIMWTCTECLPVASHVYGVPMSSKRKFEQDARKEAIAAIGQTLLGLRKTDFMELTEEEALTVFAEALKAYQDALREALKNHAAPF